MAAQQGKTTSLEDDMDCGIRVHGDRSPNNGSIEMDLCIQPHGAHERGIYNIDHASKQGWGEEPLPGPATLDDADHAGATPLAIFRTPPAHVPHPTGQRSGPSHWQRAVL